MSSKKKSPRGPATFDPVKLMPYLLGIYERQVHRDLARLGVEDEEESARRVKAMRDWANFCLREKDPQIRTANRVETFGKDRELRIQREPKANDCRICHGDGMFYSDACQPRRHNENRVKGPGFITCECRAGTMRNTAIRDHGRTALPRKSRREDF